MRQVVYNAKLETLRLPALTEVKSDLIVRACPRPRSAERARSRTHRAEPSLLLSLRMATRASVSVRRLDCGGSARHGVYCDATERRLRSAAQAG